jgi:hypothetical protein
MRSIKKDYPSHTNRALRRFHNFSSVSQLIDVEIFEHASSSSGRFDGEGDAVMCPRRNRAVVPLMEQHF